MDAVERGVEAVDHQLQERVTPAEIEAARAVLLALADIKVQSGDRNRKEATGPAIPSLQPDLPGAGPG